MKAASTYGRAYQALLLSRVVEAAIRIAEYQEQPLRTIPFEPPIPGVMPGVDRPKIILAQDIDYPPFAELGPANEDFPVSGFGVGFAMGLEEVCDIDMVVVQTDWANCWTGETIGAGLAAGEFHGCPTYTHAAGVRNRYLEFSNPILDDNRSAGILTRLVDGRPIVNGLSNLDGIKVVDVTGFAPTTDTLALVTNRCTNEVFGGYEFVPTTSNTGNPNDDALLTLLSGDADVMWVCTYQFVF